MKTLIVYLSLTDNTEKVAHIVSSKLGNCTLRKIEVKTRVPKSDFLRILKFGFYQTFKISPKYVVDLDGKDNYDLVLVGSPVWMGKAAPPVLDVIKRNFQNHSNIAFFSTYNADSNNVEKHLLKDAGLQEFISTLNVQSPVDENNEDIQYQINEFISEISESKDKIMGKKTHLSEVIKGSVQSHLN